MNPNQLWRMLKGKSIDEKYHIKDFLGAGGYGGVFLADEVVDDDFQRQVAVKLISPDKDPKKRENQRKELKNAVNLKHPNLLDCFVPGLCQIKGTEFFYLVMELAEETLEQRLLKGILSATEAIEIVKGITSALAYLHNGSPPQVHRDVKPGNLLRVGGNRWKLADFGLLTALGSQSSAFTSNRRASIKYAPPEAYQGKVATAWDIWSLGVMIVEMLTGELPFRGETEALLMNQVINDSPSIDWSKVPAPFVDIIQGCLEKNREKRYTAQRVFDQVAKFPPQIISSILITNLAVSPWRDSSVYYDFFVRCPACLATGRVGSNDAWFCSICGAKIQIGNDAYLKCLNGHSCHISHARYACKNHPSEYEPTTDSYFASTISTSSLVASLVGRRWLIELLENLGDDW